jgi:hypothetical protein
MGGMTVRGYSREEIVRRGREIYEREIREKVEPEHGGDFVVVDVTTGAWEVDKDDVKASDRVLDENPDAVLYFMRVGRPAAYRVGGGRWGRSSSAR